jgi:hypothetical protein
VETEAFSTWIRGLARRTGMAEAGADALPLPGRVSLRACIDGQDETECVAGHLRAWRLAGVAPNEIAVVAGRAAVAEALAGPAPAPGMRVGEIGRTDLSGVRALALVGCDARFALAEAGGFGTPDHERETVLPILRACAAPREHLLITWRGRPDRLFAALADRDVLADQAMRGP